MTRWIDPPPLEVPASFAGLSLPPLIRWLGVKEDSSSAVEERKARLKANQEAYASLKEIDGSDFSAAATSSSRNAFSLD